MRKILIHSFRACLVFALSLLGIAFAQQTAEDFFKSGNAKAITSDWDGASPDYSKVIELNPQDVTAYHNRGSAKGKNGDWDVLGSVGRQSGDRVGPNDAVWRPTPNSPIAGATMKLNHTLSGKILPPTGIDRKPRNGGLGTARYREQLHDSGSERV